LFNDNLILLKDIQNNGKSLLLPDGNDLFQHIMFSNGVDGHHSIFIRHNDDYEKDFIKIWSPFLIDDEDDANNTDNLISLFERPY
jgi:hypothetical protein